MLQNLQGLRAIAAFLVVLHHLIPHYTFNGGYVAAVEGVRSFTFAGVDIFFVISGFVIALTTVRLTPGKSDALRFIHNRACRIYLGYWPFFFLALMLVARFQPEGLDDVDFIKSFLLSTVRLNELLLDVAWTLTYELYFYVLFAGLVFLAPQARIKIIAVLFVLIAASSIVSPFMHYHGWKFFISPYLLEFFSGVLLYHFREKLMDQRLLIPFVVAGLLAFAFGCVYAMEMKTYRVATFGVTAFVLVWLFIYLEHRQLFTAKGLLVTTGDASYTLYLCHVVLLKLFYYTGIMGWFGRLPVVIKEVVFVLLVVFIVRFSIEFYRSVEAPLYKRFRWSHK